MAGNFLYALAYLARQVSAEAPKRILTACHLRRLRDRPDWLQGFVQQKQRDPAETPWEKMDLAQRFSRVFSMKKCLCECFNTGIIGVILINWILIGSNCFTGNDYSPYWEG